MSESPSTPSVVGRYAIFDVIASGGMAAVHFARLVGPSGFARTVAVKRPHPHLVREMDFSLMFIDEARLAAKIRHPNVVSTLDVIQNGNDLLLVMEYVHGEALSKLASVAEEKGQRIPIPIAASIMIDALHGLHAAHEVKDEQGNLLDIVHRDVSPQNILVGVDGITRIVDFGIAKAAGRLHTTRDSSIKGKCAYMAPEQVRGEKVSRLTDTFAASIVFWEMLTGRRLFAGDTEAETVHKCLAMPILPPSQHVPDLPRQLDEIVRRGLCRDPRYRYQTARAMALDIEECVPAIRASEVSAWVERIAGDTLSKRAQILHDIERTGATEDLVPTLMIPSGSLQNAQPASSKSPRPISAQSSGRSVSWVVGPDGLPVPRGEYGSMPTGSGIHSEAHAKSVRVERRRSWAIAWMGVGALFIGFLVVVMMSSRRNVARIAPSAAAQPSSSAPPLVVSPPVMNPSGTSPMGMVAPPLPSVAPPTPTAPPQPTPSRGSRRTGGSRPPAPSAKSGVNCDPPYSIDSIGRQIFKPECM